MKTISKQEAKDFMVGYHFIHSHGLKNKESIKTIFSRIQSIQYDPLDVVGRNSELVLQSRILNFKKSMLDEALYHDRILIDGWDKQMGIYLKEDYPYFTRIREARAQSEIEVFQYRLQLDALQYTNQVTDIIKENGPTFSKDINLGESRKQQWGRTKPSSAAIDYLFHVGGIGIHSRKGAQKRYDLMENLIGDLANTVCPFDLDEDFIKYYLLRRIKSMGLVWNKSSVAFSGLFIHNKKTRIKYIDLLLKEKLIEELSIEGLTETFYIPYGALQDTVPIKKNVSFIAPLDNLIWDRELIKKVFDFEYTWEVYTPVIKRKYGYYVLPVLYGSDFIGRVEFEKYRKDGDFAIKAIWWEAGIKQTKKLQMEFQKALNRFEKYLK